MIVEVAYAQYEAAGGGLSEKEFESQLPRAIAAVGYLVGINEVTDEAKYRQAVFAAVESYAASGPAGAGFSIGTFKMERSSAEAARAEAVAAAYEVLATTGMVYAGVG